MRNTIASLTAASAIMLATPVLAQEESSETSASADPYADTVFSGDYLSVGIGAAINASYAGSNDYVISPLPIVQGSYKGIDINPRAAGLALDFIPDPENGPGIDFGISARLRSDRAVQISDPVVKSLGKLDRAVEIGPTAGISFPGVLNPYDSLTISSDVRWDVAGAHDGMVIDSSVSYFTPVNRGVAGSLTVTTEYGDGDFRDYYFTLTPEQSLATGGELPVFSPDGGGFNSVGATLLVGVDLDGDLANGGWALVAIGGYSRRLGDAADTPYTSVRGSADQFLGALGIGYTF